MRRYPTLRSLYGREFKGFAGRGGKNMQTKEVKCRRALNADEGRLLAKNSGEKSYCRKKIELLTSNKERSLLTGRNRKFSVVLFGGS
jgi:hypothetical protein